MGEPRTPGYWKNWNRVTSGGQADNADRNGGCMDGFWLLEGVLDPNIGGITWDDILVDGFVFSITDAAVAVDILDQRKLGDPATCTTGSDGACTITRSNIGSTVPSLTLEVTGLALSGYEYDAAASEETSITIAKPL